MSERSLVAESVRTPSVASEGDLDFYRRKSDSNLRENDEMKRTKKSRHSLDKIRLDAPLGESLDEEEVEFSSHEELRGHWGDHDLDSIEIWPDGLCEYRKVSRSYVLKIAREAEPLSDEMAVKMFSNKTGGQDIKKVMRLQLGNGLQHRDFRQVDPSFIGKSVIWVRRNALVVSLDDIRAIILCNRCFVFNVHKINAPQLKIILGRLGEVEQSSDSDEINEVTFEFKALESILVATTSQLEHDFDKLDKSIIAWSRDKANLVDGLRLQKYNLNRMNSRIDEKHDVLNELLNNDEDMASMYLTELHQNPGFVRDVQDHEEAELLLETYAQHVEFLKVRGGVLQELVEDLEDLVGLRLDALQNRLLLVNLIIQLVTAVFGFGSLVSAVFGMNMVLPPNMSELPSSRFYFYGVVAITVSIMGCLMMAVFLWLGKVGIWRPGGGSVFHSSMPFKTMRRKAVENNVEQTKLASA